MLDFRSGHNFGTGPFLLDPLEELMFEKVDLSAHLKSREAPLLPEPPEGNPGNLEEFHRLRRRQDLVLHGHNLTPRH